jgi:Flp pilus assembly protein TadD
MDESLVEMKRALELDPLSPMINVTLAWLYLERREVDRAIEQARKAVELDPNFVYSRYALGLCLRLKGMFKEAVAELQKARVLFGSSPSGLGDLGMAYALSGEKAKATEVLSILEKYSQRGYLVSSEIALVYLGLGEKDKALEWLDKVCDDEDEISYLRDSGYLEIEPEWDSLRSDPRFKLMLKKLHLE